MVDRLIKPNRSVSSWNTKETPRKETGFAKHHQNLGISFRGQSKAAPSTKSFILNFSFVPQGPNNPTLCSFLLIMALQVLDSSYIKECSAVMASAFADSPSYNFILKDHDMQGRVKALQWIFARGLEVVVNKYPAALRGIIENDKVIVCFLLTPVQYQNMTSWELLTAGIWQIPFRFGFGTFSRLVAMIQWSEKVFHVEEKSDSNDGNSDGKDGVLPKERNHFILERMVVLPEFQGQGWGSKALRQALEDENIPEVHLTTQEERNCQFYKRLGFEITNEYQCFPEDPVYGFHNWEMILRKSEQKASEAHRTK